MLLNGYPFCGLQLCVTICFLQEHIIHELHCEGHFGWDKILVLASTDYYWPKLPGQVFNFVKRCAIC